MKRGWIVLFFLGICWSCKPSEETKISVQIEGLQRGMTPVLVAGGKEYVLRLDSCGYAECIPEASALPVSGWLQCGKYRVSLYLEAEKSFGIYMNLNPELLGVEFKGAGTLKNEILNGKYFQEGMESDFSQREPDFIREVEAKLVRLDSELNTLVQDSAFRQLLREKYDYKLLAELGEYPVRHAELSGQPYHPSSFYLSYLDSLVRRCTPRMHRKEYREAIRGWVETIVNGAGKDRSEEERLRFCLSYLDSVVVDPGVAEFLTDHFVRVYVQEKGIDSVRLWENFYWKKVQAEDLRNSFKKLCESWERIAPGQAAPSFAYLTADSVQLSLESFSGNYLYLVLESSSSGEKVRLQDLEKRFGGKNIRFVTITYGEEWNVWKTRMQARQPGGIQLYGGEPDSLPALFRIRKFPSFILLDKTGRIMRTGMSGPLDPATVSLLRHLEGI